MQQAIKLTASQMAKKTQQVPHFRRSTGRSIPVVGHSFLFSGDRRGQARDTWRSAGRAGEGASAGPWGGCGHRGAPGGATAAGP